MPAYGSAYIYSLKPIITKQKLTIRLVTNSKYNAYSDPLFKKCGILKFPDLLDFIIIDFIPSLSHNLLPISFSNIWMRKDTMNLRNMLDYNIPFERLKFSQRLPLHTFPKVWNDLDEPDIKNIICLSHTFLINFQTMYFAITLSVDSVIRHY